MSLLLAEIALKCSRLSSLRTVVIATKMGGKVDQLGSVGIVTI